MGKKAKELGMNVVLSDVRQEPLSKAIRTLRMEKEMDELKVSSVMSHRKNRYKLY